MKLNLNCVPENQRLMAARQKQFRENPTPSEIHVRDLLSSMGERFIFQKGFFTRYRFFLVDFYFPRPRRLCLELDGRSHDRQPAYDAMRDRFLSEVRQFRVHRISNEDALRLDAPAMKQMLESAVNEATTSERV